MIVEYVNSRGRKCFAVARSGEEKRIRKNCKPRWGYYSYAMAVDPEDIPKAQAILAKHGVRTTYNRHGEPLIESRQHRNAHARAMGFYDRNCGYGDVQPNNR